eukprot:2519365-Pleurochrysis_carterae.AAC.1
MPFHFSVDTFRVPFGPRACTGLLVLSGQLWLRLRFGKKSAAARPVDLQVALHFSSLRRAEDISNGFESA